jgi:hypothetical protein
MTRAEAEFVLDNGRLFVVFRPTSPGIRIPEHLMSAPRVTLCFSTLYDTGGVELDDDYISQALSFGGRICRCHVPLAAVEHFYGADHDLQPAPVPQAPRLRLVGDDET